MCLTLGSYPACLLWSTMLYAILHQLLTTPREGEGFPCATSSTDVLVREGAVHVPLLLTKLYFCLPAPTSVLSPPPPQFSPRPRLRRTVRLRCLRYITVHSTRIRKYRGNWIYPPRGQNISLRSYLAETTGRVSVCSRLLASAFNINTFL
jgi:hypothetical protein